MYHLTRARRPRAVRARRGPAEENQNDFILRVLPSCVFVGVVRASFTSPSASHMTHSVRAFLDHFSKADLLAGKPAAVTSQGSPSLVSELNIARARWIRLPVEENWTVTASLVSW